MTGEHLKKMRLTALAVLGVVLFNYPILSLVNRRAEFMGIPVLFLYLFGVWILLIVLTAWIAGSRKTRRPAPPPD